MSHTPAPWRSPWLPGSKQRCAGVSAGDCYVYLNVAVGDDTDETIERWKHDARLIAAAPEMLQTLKALRSFMWKEGYADTVPVMAKADVVISKATGGAE